ncbi:hypothetical protein GCM10011395_14130 [Sphingomonas psychrolutea]|uniref:Uncharacterized protein n=2 Tax=Sphingomonas psychrolutea TaxID=1259676 RepID=A0ABQ1GK10_9SPHN|nr:hypothetical protein GCM10011395_14130 [Sphingomonas psychrolutea]
MSYSQLKSTPEGKAAMKEVEEMIAKATKPLISRIANLESEVVALRDHLDGKD